MKTKKNVKIFALTLLTALLLLAILSPTMISVKAQTQGTVIILDSVGGTTDPAAGTYNYNDGTSVTFTATPNDVNFVFAYWIVSTDAGSSTVSINPLVLPIAGGVTYNIQAVFSPIQAPPGGLFPAYLPTAAIVVVLAAVGGTTTPAPGTYAIDNASSLMLTATPDSGFQFSHWVISGSPLIGAHGNYSFTDVPTDNPYNVNHGYGNTYNYQPVFIPTGSTVPTPTGGATPTPSGTVGGLSMDSWIIIALVAVIIVILIAFAVFASRRRSK